MSDDQAPSIEVRVCSPEHYGVAIWLATGADASSVRRGRVAAILAAQQRGDVHFDGLLVAQAGKRVLGALWLLDQPGRTANLWGPRLVRNAGNRVGSRLIADAIQLARSKKLCLVQSLTEPGLTELTPVLGDAGFQKITTVEQLACSPVPPDCLPPSGETSFPHCGDPRETAFLKVLEGTYAGSLDCPELDGLRAIGDVVQGYLHTSRNQTAHWHFVQWRETLAGVVLLAHHQSLDQLELIYFGILPGQRRQGLGGEVLRFVLAEAERLGCRELVTAADQRNLPVRDLYRQAGFHVTHTREYWMLPLGSTITPE